MKNQTFHGVILIDSGVVSGERYWSAVLYKHREPRMVGLSVADKTLVESVSRFAESFDACRTKAKEIAAKCGYPNAVVRLNRDAQTALSEEMAYGEAVTNEDTDHAAPTV